MSRRTRNWIIILVLIPAAAYGAARLAVWYSVKDTLASARDSLSPVASLEHTKILSPVFGAFGATGVRIKPHIFNEGISIGSVLVNINDPIEKYNVLHAAMNDTLPTSFNLSLNKVRVPLDDEIAAWFDQKAGPAGPAAGPPPACAAGAPFTVKDMKAMGYKELVAHFVLDYAYDRRSGGLVTYANMKLEDMFEVTLEGKIPPGEVVFAVDRIAGFPKLSDLSISLSDSSWSSRFNRYCAEALGIAEREYVQRRISEMRQMLAAVGFEPSEELMTGLEKFTAGAASLTLSLNPRDPIDLTQLAAGQDAEEVVDGLGLEVLIDGKPVRNLGTAAKEAPEDIVRAEEQEDETYQSTPMRELTLYLQNRVKIFTDDGKVHEGHLDSVDAEKIIMTRHLVGGSVTFDVNRKDVKEVLVLRP